MKIKRILLLLVVIDLMLLIQVIATAKATQINNYYSVHQDLDAFVNSEGFKKYKNDHFPKVSGEVKAIVTIQKRTIVSIQIEKSTIKNQLFLSTFTNYLMCQRLSMTAEFGVFDHRFLINRF